MLIFFFNDTATTEIYTLSLHDALPIFRRRDPLRAFLRRRARSDPACSWTRSEEHTSELQSQSISYAVFCLKKKNKLAKNKKLTFPCSVRTATSTKLLTDTVTLLRR